MPEVLPRDHFRSLLLVQSLSQFYTTLYIDCSNSNEVNFTHYVTSLCYLCNYKKTVNTITNLIIIVIVI